LVEFIPLQLATRLRRLNVTSPRLRQQQRARQRGCTRWPSQPPMAGRWWCSLGRPHDGDSPGCTPRRRLRTLNGLARTRVWVVVMPNPQHRHTWRASLVHPLTPASVSCGGRGKSRPALSCLGESGKRSPASRLSKRQTSAVFAWNISSVGYYSLISSPLVSSCLPPFSTWPVSE